MTMLNLGVLAHVDAGKTSLTERLLQAAGVIDEVGSVDRGSTHTDTLALERQRGITIRSAVVSFVIGDVTVNLIDTPGHPDFIAEVERVLGVLDGAVLVVSAVEGVQAQTRVLMRVLRRLGIPTLIFVNKIDRAGAAPQRVLQEIADRLSPAVVAMGSVHGEGGRRAAFTSWTGGDDAFADRLAQVLIEHDEALLAACVEGSARLHSSRLRQALVTQTGRALVHPVFFGSAITGAGVDALIAGIAALLPACDPDDADEQDVSGVVFKVERGEAGEKVAYVRMFSGTLHVRETVTLRSGHQDRVTAISVFDAGAEQRAGSVGPGRIARVWGLAAVQVGDVIGRAPTAYAAQQQFAPPSLETVIDPPRAADRGRLLAALTQLGEQDPLIDVRQDDVRREIVVSLYGEVQKEVIQATLGQDYDVAVTFRETRTICVERPTGSGWAVQTMGGEDNPFLATVGLRVERAAAGNGVHFALRVEQGCLPRAFFTAVEHTVRETLRQGLHGWEVIDCLVVMTHAGYSSPHSTAGDFRDLTPLVLMDALRAAGTAVHEPIHRCEIEVPADTLGPTLAGLAQARGVAQEVLRRGTTYLITGEIPAGRVHRMQRQLPRLTRGEGVLSSEHETYRQVRGTVPTRPRTDDNPLDRRDYLRRLAQRS